MFYLYFTILSYSNISTEQFSERHPENVLKTSSEHLLENCVRCIGLYLLILHSNDIFYNVGLFLVRIIYHKY